MMHTPSLHFYLSPLPLIAVLRGITPPEVTAIRRSPWIASAASRVSLDTGA